MELIQSETDKTKFDNGIKAIRKALKDREIFSSLTKKQKKDWLNSESDLQMKELKKLWKDLNALFAEVEND